MAELYDAATAWQTLLCTEYEITYGKKRVLHTLHLSFHPDQFSHLSGIHHVDDIDLKIPFNKEKFFNKVLNHEFDNINLQNSIYWGDISGRLDAITKLQSILDSDFVLYLFQRNILPFYSDIDANYLIKNPATNDVVFLFLDGSSQSLFCRSVFTKSDRAYSCNQKSVVVLKKVKIKNNQAEIIFNKITESE